MEGVGLRRDGEGRHKLSPESERSESFRSIYAFNGAPKSLAEQSSRSQYI